jgi:hypothetical protein
MVLSGGQTGVDRAALNAALALGIPCGGWCPGGRRAEDGTIPPRYPLRETDAPDYDVRTRLNVVAAEATLVLTPGMPTRGTAVTVQAARASARPYLIVDPFESGTGMETWLARHGRRVLNVAGPRESHVPGIHDRVLELLLQVWG